VQSVPETYGQSPDALPLPGESPGDDAAPTTKIVQPG
jgi:putative MFS transporter